MIVNSMPTQAQLFDIERIDQDGKLRNNSMIRTVSTSNAEILEWIKELYLPDGLDLDCTFNKGFIYVGTELRPRIRFDIHPKPGVTAAADFTQLPLKDGSVGSAVFDPPFFASNSSCKLTKQYGFYPRPEPLWESYRAALRELSRVLRVGGTLVMKCQDFIYGRKQYLVHANIITFAQTIKLYARDLFIKIQPHVAIGWNHHNQNHARKTHCYYVVFQKKRKIIPTI